MTPKEPTRVVVLTPEGAGAIASVLVVGPAAIRTVDGLFHALGGQRLVDRPERAIALGRWQSALEGEEVVAARSGAERVEIHCHGGQAASAAIVASLVERGCQQISWRQWIVESQADPIAAAALMKLAQAPTERTAAVLYDQYRGALGAEIEQIASRIARGDSREASRRLDTLLGWAPLGLHLVEPWRVALAGRPNVGKSSLVNALVGYQRAIVHPTAGTTRDVVAVSTAIDGWPVELADTAGQHAEGEGLEAAGMQRARQQLAVADLVVLVCDASMPSSSDDEALARAWPAALRVWNKSDLVTPAERTRGAGLVVSALDGSGVEALGQSIIGRLVPAAPPPGQAVPFTTGQVRRLVELRQALSAGDVSSAARLASDVPAWGI